jgi:hypothetical protein
LPYPSIRLMTPHTPRPAPIAVTNVCKILTALEKNPIRNFETQTPETRYYVVSLQYRENQNMIYTSFCRSACISLELGFSPFFNDLR